MLINMNKTVFFTRFQGYYSIQQKKKKMRSEILISPKSHSQCDENVLFVTSYQVSFEAWKHFCRSAYLKEIIISKWRCQKIAFEGSFSIESCKKNRLFFNLVGRQVILSTENRLSRIPEAKKQRLCQGILVIRHGNKRSRD